MLLRWRCASPLPCKLSSSVHTLRFKVIWKIVALFEVPNNAPSVQHIPRPFNRSSLVKLTLQAAKACAAPSIEWDGPPVRLLLMRNRALVAVSKHEHKKSTLSKRRSKPNRVNKLRVDAQKARIPTCTAYAVSSASVTCQLSNGRVAIRGQGTHVKNYHAEIAPLLGFPPGFISSACSYHRLDMTQQLFPCTGKKIKKYCSFRFLTAVCSRSWVLFHDCTPLLAKQ
jgi:hypothetical protein